jgi:hypothetical protein
MRGPGQEDVIEPKGNCGERRARCDHGAGKGDGILPQKVDWLRPVPDTLSQIHQTPSPLLIFQPSTHFSRRGAWSATLDSSTSQKKLDYFLRVRM